MKLLLAVAAISIGCADKRQPAETKADEAHKPEASKATPAPAVPAKPTPSARDAGAITAPAKPIEVAYCPGSAPEPPKKSKRGATRRDRPNAAQLAKKLGSMPTTRLQTELGSADEPAGARSAQQINAAIGTIKNQLRRCYQSELADAPELAGTVTLTMTVTKDGSVEKLCIAKNNIGSETVPRCLAGQLAALELVPAETESTVTYPFHFASVR